MAIGGFHQVKTGGQRVYRQFLGIGNVGRRQLLAPPGYQLVVIQQGDLSKLGHADYAAAASQTGLACAQPIAVLQGELAAEEAPDHEP